METKLNGVYLGITFAFNPFKKLNCFTVHPFPDFEDFFQELTRFSLLAKQETNTFTDLTLFLCDFERRKKKGNIVATKLAK